MNEPQVVLQASTPEIAELILACARKEITFDICCAYSIHATHISLAAVT